MNSISAGNGFKGKNSFGRKLLVFLVFQLVFAIITMPLLIFYGPFDNVKRTLVGMSMNTLRHQYIARMFLSDKAIARILSGSYAIDPTIQGESIHMLKFGVNHSDKIDVYNIKGSDFDGKMLVIHDPTSIKIGYSSLIPKSGETTSAIAKRNKAVAAINGGGFMDKAWVGTGGAPMGIIIHEGKLLYGKEIDKNLKQDTVAFTRDGMLIVGKHSINKLMEYGVCEAVTFGPPLIVNGKPTITKGDGGWGIAPRTAIGQTEDGKVIFLVIDGRSLKSLGATLREVQDILLKHGAVNAVNLDGGSSTTMYLDGKVINRPSDSLGERAVPSVFMVLPNNGGAN